MISKSKLKENIKLITYLPSSLKSSEWISYGVRIELTKENGEIIRWGYKDLATGMIVNSGQDILLKLLRGDAETPFNTTNAKIGVGDGYLAAATSQTDLQGFNKLRKSMDSPFPLLYGESDGPINPGEMKFKSTFGSSEANFLWTEFGIFNSISGGTMLDRFVQNLGLKNGGIWALEITISVS